MKLIKLLGIITKIFSEHESKVSRLQRIKNGNARDVVTELDIKLHNATHQFLKSEMPDVKLISEEGDTDLSDLLSLNDCEYFLLDPLDGSNNVETGFDDYGYMGCVIRNGVVTGSIICIPNLNIYLIFDEEKYFSSHEIDCNFKGNTTYYAYPPRLTQAGEAIRSNMLNLIDENTAGMYRYGSACVGLYNTIIGKHIAFVAQSVRIWDVLPYFPFLAINKFYISYKISQDNLYLIVSKNKSILNLFGLHFQKNGIFLDVYDSVHQTIK